MTFNKVKKYTGGQQSKMLQWRQCKWLFQRFQSSNDQVNFIIILNLVTKLLMMNYDTMLKIYAKQNVKLK